MSIYFKDRIIQSINFEDKIISTVYKGVKKIWEIIKSCFGKGVWINTFSWDNNDAWKNNSN